MGLKYIYLFNLKVRKKKYRIKTEYVIKSVSCERSDKVMMNNSHIFRTRLIIYDKLKNLA